MKRATLLFATLSLVLGLVPAPARAGSDADDVKKFDKSYTFTGDKDIKVGIKVGDVTIDSFRVRHWPDHDNFEKGDKDLNDTHTVWVEFQYSNRDMDHDYKCKYVVTVPGKDGNYAQNDRTANLDKGKIDDTNKVSLKMKTHQYKLARTIKISFEIWKKR